MTLAVRAFSLTSCGRFMGFHMRRSFFLDSSRVGLEWALPGVVVGVVVPFSVSIGDALELLVSDIVVGVGVWSWSVDTLLTRDSLGWSVSRDGSGGSNKSNEDEFHFS